jgi:hypothetical protein
MIKKRPLLEMATANSNRAGPIFPDLTRDLSVLLNFCIGIYAFLRTFNKDYTADKLSS